MENNDMPKDKSQEKSDLTEKYIYDYKELLPELADNLQKTIQDAMATTFKEAVDEAIEAVRQETPAFKDIHFEQLKDDKNFQYALKEYLLKHPPKPPTLEMLKSIIPKKHIKPVNKLANKITKDIVDEGEFNLIITSGKAKKEVYTKVMLTYKNENIQLKGQKYTPYDREVYDGVVTLYVAGNRIITPVMVYRAMNGLTETEYISPQALEAVTKSLNKSMHIYTIIDYTDEAKMYNKKVEKTTYEGYLLAATKITVKINGQEHEAYEILNPILYEYARISGQIISVPIKVLQTKDAVRSTDEVIVIRGYLLRQIEWIKNAKTIRSENITYRGVYEELEISKIDLKEKAYENKTRLVRKHIKAILDEWQEQEYVKKYEEYKDGKTLTGVTIFI